MLIFLGSLGVGVGFCGVKLYTLFLCSPWINGLILASFLAGLCIPFMQLQRLAKDHVFWSRIQTVDPAVNFPSDLLGKPVSPLLESFMITPERHVKTSFTVNEVQFALKGVSRRLHERHGFVRYLMGILVLLGLLGTFFGLTQTVGAIATSLKGLSFDSNLLAEAFQNMKLSIQRPLSGMEVAFSSSIFGLIGSLILGFMDLLQRNAERDFYNELEPVLLSKQKKDLARDSNGPVYVLALLEQTAENLNLLQHRITQVEDSNVRMTHTWQEISTIIAKSVQKTTQMQDAFDVLCQMQDSITRELHTLGTNFSSFASTRTEKIQTLCNDLKRILEEMTEGRKLALRDLKEEIRVISKTLSLLTAPEEDVEEERSTL